MIQVLLAGILGCCLVLTSAADAGAARRDGTPVPSFGSGGRVLTGFPAAETHSTYVDQIIPLPGGGTMVLGTGGDGYYLGRFLADGSVDRSFGAEGYVHRSYTPDRRRIGARSIALQSDGGIVVAAGDGVRFGVLLRHQADGRLDPDFGNGGVVDTASTVSLVAADSNDRLVSVGGSGRTEVSRFLPGGAPDPAFGENGIVRQNFSSSSGFGGLSLAGSRITISSPFAGTLRLLGDGSPDSGFGSGGVSPYPGYRMAVQGDGRTVLVSGSGQVQRLLNNGSPDPTFGQGGTATYAAGDAYAVGIDDLGRITVGGVNRFLGPGTPRDFEMVRLLPSGDLDPGFSGDGYVTSDVSSGWEDGITSMVVGSDGGVVAAGNARTAEGSQEIALARFSEDGTLDLSFGSGDGVNLVKPVIPTRDQILDLAGTSDGGIVAAGINGSGAGLVDYLPSGKLDRQFGSNGRFSARFLESSSGERAEAVTALPGNAVAVCSSSGSGVAVSRFFETGLRDPAFGQALGLTVFPEWRRCGSILRDSEGRLMVAGVDGQNRARLARLNSDGLPDLDFGEAGETTGPTLSPSGGGVRDIHMDLAPNGDMLFAGDRFGVTVARFTERGERRQSFGRNGVVSLSGIRDSQLRLGRAESVQVDGQGRILIGGVKNGAMAIVALRPDGRLLRSFGKGGIVTRDVLETAVVEDLLVQPDGSIVAVGWASERCGRIAPACPFHMVATRYKSSGRSDTGFARRGVFLRRFGLASKATSVLNGRRGLTIGGYAETMDERREFLLVRLRR